ncbi:MAG: thioredoxin [Methanobacteriota archaeon]|nr:MAG: thioredoxin [Euryarchaeota archaeon]
MDDLEAIRARKLAELQSHAEAQAFRKAAAPAHLTDATFEAEVAKGGVLLVDFWAAWCGPCLRLAPTIEQLAADLAGRVRVAKLNTDENPLTPSRFGITSIPTLLVFRGGKLVDGIVGAVPRQEIEAVLNRWT